MASRIHTLFAAGLAVLASVGAVAPADAAASRTASSTISAASAPPASALAADSPGTSTFGIQPLPRTNTDTRSAFTFSATPGAQPKDAVEVTNFSTQPLTLHVYASDAFNTPEGGYDLLAGDVSPKDVGTWVKLTNVPPFITIPGRSHAIIPFTLAIPFNAGPGDHAGGIVASLTTPSTDSHGNRVNVEQRVGSRIYVRVSGVLKAGISVSRISAVYHTNWSPLGSGAVTVTYTVSNTGNVRLAAHQAVHVTSLFGGSVLGDPVRDIQELLPGNSIQVTATVRGVLPSFVSTARVAVDPVALPGDLDPKLVGTTNDATMLTIPWSALILLVLLAGLVFLYFRRRRASAPMAPASAGPAPAPAPAVAVAEPVEKAEAMAVSKAATASAESTASDASSEPAS